MPVLEVSGARHGRYEIREERDDGTLVIAPDTSIVAIHEELGTTPMGAEDFQTTFGGLRTDGEG